MPHDAAPRLAVLGGGLTGAALAIHALRAASGPLAVEIVEPAEALGRGAAYGTADPAHRINVPSHRMSLFPDDPGHFTRWLFDRAVLPDPASTVAEGDHYVPRAAFGAYAADALARAVAEAAPRATLRHHRARASAVTPCGPGWRVAFEGGGGFKADAVALCTGHPAPVAPCPVSEAALAHPGLVADPWARRGLRARGAGRRRAGRRHRPDHARRHGDARPAGAPRPRAGRVAPRPPAPPAGRVPRRFRSLRLPLPCPAPPWSCCGSCATASTVPRPSRIRWGWAGKRWRTRFRSRLAPLWSALPPSEQRRVARRLLPFWEVHRFRAAPQPFALVERWRAEGRLGIERAALAGLDVRDGRPRRRPARARARLGRPGLRRRGDLHGAGQRAGRRPAGARPRRARPRRAGRDRGRGRGRPRQPHGRPRRLGAGRIARLRAAHARQLRRDDGRARHRPPHRPDRAGAARRAGARPASPPRRTTVERARFSSDEPRPGGVCLPPPGACRGTTWVAINLLRMSKGENRVPPAGQGGPSGWPGPVRAILPRRSGRSPSTSSPRPGGPPSVDAGPVERR